MVSFIINGKINFSSGGGFFLSIPLSCAFLPLFEESLARHFALCYNVRGIDGAPSFLRHLVFPLTGARRGYGDIFSEPSVRRERLYLAL